MPRSSLARHRIRRATLWVAALSGLALGAASARPAQQAASIAIEPDSLTLEVGETAQLTATVMDAAGNPVADARVVFFSGNRRALTVTPGGHVSANQPGDHEVTALLPDQAFDGNWDYYSSRDPGLRASVRVSVSTPALADIFFENAPPRVWAGTEVRFPLAGRDAAGQVRHGLEAGYATSDNGIAVVDQVGMASFLTPGSVQVAAMHGEMTIYHEVEVLPNPTARVALDGPDRPEVRTGDVLQFRAAALDASGSEIAGPAIRFAVESRPDPFRPESLGAGAAAQVTPDGRFVAEQPGCTRWWR